LIPSHRNRDCGFSGSNPNSPPLCMLQVCCRLFERRSHPPLPLKRMSMVQVEDFRTHGYVVMDGMLTKEAAGRIKAEALRLAQKGKAQRPFGCRKRDRTCSCHCCS
jgi:hypothetical protein